MKNTTSLIILSAFIFCSCSNKEITTIISGSIKGGMVEEIIYTLPLNNTIYEYFQDTVRVDENNNFEIILPNRKIVFINCYFNGLPDGEENKTFGETTLLVEPGKSIEITIDMEDTGSPWKITGENEKARSLYMELPLDCYMESMPFKEDGISVNLASILEEKKTNELAPFRDLVKSGGISTRLYKAIESERNYFYAFLAASVLIETYDEKLPDPEIVTKIEEIFTNYPPHIDLFRFSWGYEYLNTYIFHFILRIKEKYTYVALEKKMSHENGYTFFMNKTLPSLPAEVKEYYQATFLYSIAADKYNEPELLVLYESFRETYPESLYIPYLEPLMKEVRIYRKIVEAPFKETMIFIEDPIDSFESLIELFKGQKLYIDVWATWCTPCKREFAYGSALKKYLKEKDTSILYISIDEDNRDTSWKEMIKYFNLEGYHIRVKSETLSKQLLDLHSEGKGYIAIPWYILIDEKGNIVEKYAKAPSKLVGKNE